MKWEICWIWAVKIPSKTFSLAKRKRKEKNLKPTRLDLLMNTAPRTSYIQFYLESELSGEILGYDELLERLWSWQETTSMVRVWRLKWTYDPCQLSVGQILLPSFSSLLDAPSYCVDPLLILITSQLVVLWEKSAFIYSISCFLSAWKG